MTTSSATAGLRRPGWWLMVVALVAADLASKAWAFEAVGERVPPEPVLGDWLSIYCIRNPGGIWGLGQNLTLPLTIVRLIAVGVLLWLAARQPRGMTRGVFTLGLLLAGAVGNLYDNLSAWLPWPGDGRVRDFVRVDFAEPGWWPDFLGWPFAPWPIFNLADSCIFVGFLFLVTGFAHLQVERPGKDADDEDEGRAEDGDGSR